MNQRFKDQLVLHVIVLIWGYTGIIGKQSTLDADQLVFLRMGIAFVSLLLFVRKSLFQVPLDFVIKFMGVGAIIACHWVTFFAAIDASNVSVALACMATTSVFAAFLEPLFFKRSLAVDEVITSLIAMVGVLLIFGVAGGYQKGIILALISSALAAIFTILNGILLQQNIRSWHPEGGSTQMTAYEMLGGFITLSLFIGITGEPISQWELSSENIGLALILGVFCTALPFAGAIKVMRSLSPFTACLTVNLEPIYAIVLAVMHFGASEQMSMSFYLAALLIIGSVTINGIVKGKQDDQLNEAEKVSGDDKVVST